MDQYIIAKTGIFADGTGACYQLFEHCRDFNHGWYEPVLHVENSPVNLSKARARLEKLNEERRADD